MTMKIPPTLIFASLAVLSFASGEDLPADVQRLVEHRDRETARINERFVRDLEAIRNRYERAGKQEMVKRIDNLFGTGKFVLAGKWQMYNRGRKESGLREFRDGVMFFNERQFPVAIHGDVIRITWGRSFELLAISDDPQVLLGANNSNQHLRMVKVE